MSNLRPKFINEEHFCISHLSKKQRKEPKGSQRHRKLERREKEDRKEI
jgi:hypothetical protein